MTYVIFACLPECMWIVLRPAGKPLELNAGAKKPIKMGNAITQIAKSVKKGSQIDDGFAGLGKSFRSVKGGYSCSYKFVL